MYNKLNTHNIHTFTYQKTLLHKLLLLILKIVESLQCILMKKTKLAAAKNDRSHDNTFLYVVGVKASIIYGYENAVNSKKREQLFVKHFYQKLTASVRYVFLQSLSFFVASSKCFVDALMWHKCKGIGFPI